MTSLVSWNKKLERMIFILCAVGLRIGEAPGIEINKHLSPDFLTIYIKRKAPVTNEHHPSPSAHSPEATELRESVHRDA